MPDTVKIQNGYKIRGIEPPDLASHDPSTRKLYWGWVVELGLRRKDKELSQGLDKNGRPLRPISPYTRAHRKSAMTPSGKGDPGAPPLMPGLQKSRTRSLLNGRAFSTHAAFFWRYDSFTGASWAEVLSYQAAAGRDVFGLSTAGTAWVKVQALKLWDDWKAGTLRQPKPAIAQRPPRVVSPPPRGHVEASPHGLTLTVPTTSTRVAKAGPGGMTAPELTAYFRQTASATLPGRAKAPSSKSPVVGPQYNRLLQHVWGKSGMQPRPPQYLAVKPPKPKTPKPKAPAPKKPTTPTLPTRFATHDEVVTWALARFPSIKAVEIAGLKQIDVDGVPLEAWTLIADEIDFMLAKFPEVASKIRRFGAGDGPNNAIAWTTIWGDAVHFDRATWSNLKKVTKTFDKSVRDGWHPKGVEHAGLKYYVTHEMGHIVDVAAKTDNPALHTALHEPFKADNGYFDPEKARDVSEYATYNELEAVAESIAGARWRTNSDNLVIQMIKEKLGL